MNTTSHPDLKASPLSIAEQYAVAYQNSEPSNYTRMPNIINHLTYDKVDEETGNVITERLSVYGIQLYMVLRSIAGNENISWKNTCSLAELANMSEGQVVKCKRELQQKFHQLEGTPLIEIFERKKAVFREGIKISTTMYHQTMVLDIWKYNRVFFLQKKLKINADSPEKRAPSPDSPEKRASQGTDSRDERYIRHTCSNTPLSEEQHSTAEAVSVVSSKKEEEIVDVGRNSHIEWLRKVGFTAKDALNLVKNYTINELKAAANYIGYLKNKGQNIDNPLGYFRKTLENKWYERKS